MTQDITFYFDFASPYAYFAAQRIDALAAAHGRTVRWTPVLLAALRQATGSPLAPEVPLKWAYVQRDLERTARLHDIAYRQPPGFPRFLLEPGRAMLWIRQEHGDAIATAFARNCFSAYFGDGVDIGDVAVLQGIAAALGVDRAALAAGMVAPAIKQLLKQESEHALASGVFGVPFVLADGAAFWGFDRLPHLQAQLASH
ncbi:2-hydroxychromene-2-carboxylate isomerase [Rugamonas sp. CCM 8940]|uniref:2-hydroxychromene-2-carboxylate isomerase n=1 Tax=Rugamonas sp. CCM 8940 TaxID=2765359 RepID=UPI0018F51FB5|nr:2-hydroxychromene-2-carboxylate isomerase [Rugamonas sp. CCM 8940]MBJ7309794.1 2-hydroxychromene-2-carboxylate isomerase [Rugamonas sp. CCM 8940]